MPAVVAASGLPALAGTVSTAQQDVWSSIARGYSCFASPFVPEGDDIAAYEHAIATQVVAGIGGLRGLILGVTPALALMRWPQDSQILAVEFSQAVIDSIWPGDIPGRREARCGSWFCIPIDQKSCHVVVGDGSLATCRFPGEVRTLVRTVRGLLADEGVFAFRSYLRPHSPESPDAVFSALFSGKGLSVDCFKMRLYMAMQRSARQGVAVREAARVLDRFNLTPQAMKQRLGWSDAVIEPFARWRASDAVYSFPTLDELRAVYSESFDEISVSYPRYELGHCCPIIVLRRKRAG